MGANETESESESESDVTEDAVNVSADAEVTEKRDVSDVPEEEVDEQVNEMLQDDYPATAVDSESETDEEPPGPRDLTATSPDDVSVEELENQEWTLGGEISDELIEFKGTQFLLSEPDDDDILNIIAQQPGQTVDPKANMLRMCQAAIKAPQITAERWENGMNMSERLGLTMRVAQFIGIEDFMDFPDSGAEAPAGL